MRIIIRDTRTGKKVTLDNPHGLEITVETSEAGETLHGIDVGIDGGCLTIRGKRYGIHVASKRQPCHLPSLKIESEQQDLIVGTLIS